MVKAGFISVMDALIDRLKHIGLNTYEAKVYLALLKHHPATGYEISKNANVPQARAYDTLKALETQKIVVSTGGKPTTYIPIPTEELLNRYEKQYQGAIDYLRTSLPSYSVESIEPVHNLRGINAIYEHARQMIESARETIFLEIWSDDQHLLEKPLQDAAERGVAVHVVGYNAVKYDFANVYQHALADTIESSLGGRWLILAVDAYEGIIGCSTRDASEPHALWTKNPAIVLIIKELIVHDIFLLDVEQTLRDAMEQAYGKHQLKLSHKIFGREALIGAH